MSNFQIVMPKLGESIIEATIIKWLKSPGDTIEEDDAIVEIENIARHMQAGKSAYVASKEAATEIGLTVVALSLTIVAVFAPVSFMGGIMGHDGQ